MHTTEEILQAALGLPEASKRVLIEELYGSLGEGELADIRDRWALEAEDRILAFERGDIEAIPGEQVIAELKARRSA